MNKKNIIVGLILIMAVSMIFAKGNSEIAPKEDLYEIKWYVGGPGPQTDTDKVLKVFNERVKEYLPVKLNLVMVDWGSYDQKIQMVTAAQEKFDLCFTAGWINNYTKNVTKGAFLDITDMLEENAPHIMDTLPKDSWNALKINGRIYGILNYQIWARQSGFVYDAAVAENYGLAKDDLQSFKDLEKLGDAIAENKDNEYLIASRKGQTPFAFLQQYFGYDELVGNEIPGVLRINDDSRTVVNQYEIPEVVETMKIFTEWYKKGYFRQDVPTLSDFVPDQISGRAHGNFTILKPGIDETTKNTYKTDKVASIALGAPLLTTDSLIATTTAISATSKNPELVIQFYDLIYSNPELYNLLTYGLEGVHYEKLDGDFIRLTDKSNLYSPNTGWLFGNQFNAYILEGNSADIWKETIELNENAVASPALGFILNREPIEAEISAVSAVKDEYLPLLGHGAVDFEKYYPKFIEEMRFAGSDVVIKEVQRQLDAWIESNR
jgi:putative aldouronate transport system substrate-binding protein